MSSIEKAILLKAALDELRPLSKEDEYRVMQKLRIEWNFHSNHLEGNSLTFGETQALILHGITAQGKPLRDHSEIVGHNDAVQWIMEIIKDDRPLNEQFIRELHQMILKEPYEVDAVTPTGERTKKKVNIGEYKSSPNYVKTSTGEILQFASPEETPAKMQDLIDWYKSLAQDREHNPIFLATQFHYRFIRIHPFDDGNGRTARILMNFILMRAGFPPAIIRTERKKEYLSVL
ncbi:MAG: Fic family protein, partial [Bacteroidota bacterium]